MNSWNPVWEKVFQEREWGKYPAEHLVRFTARHLYQRDRSATKILDLGCGPGANLWYLAREGFDVYGIDASPTAVRKAKERLDRDGLGGDVRQGDIVSLPYADGFFDAVVELECLYANDTGATAGILRELDRVLKPGGLLYSQTFAADMPVGAAHPGKGRLEYQKVSEGPHAGLGLMRLSDRESIQSLYGSVFKLLTVDHSFHTTHDGKVRVSEWMIVCQKSLA